MSEEECEAISEWPPPDDLDNDDSESDSSDEILPVKQKFKPSYCTFLTAQKALVGWLRKNIISLKAKKNLTGMNNPKSLLNFVTETEDGRKFLQNELDIILCKRMELSDDSNYHYILATYYDKLGNYDKALEVIKRCLEIERLDFKKLFNSPVEEFLSILKNLSENQKEYLWLSAKLDFANSLKSKTSEGSIKSVAELDYSKTSVEDFQKYCRSKTPVLFKNVPNLCKHKWSLEYFKETIGDKTFEGKIPDARSTEWAGLEVAGVKKVSQFLESFSSSSPSSEYLFDWSLPLHAPELDEDFSVPSLVSEGNILKMTDRESLYHNSWPSLFIAQAGTNSGLHIDAFGSHFWMYLVSGQKKWTFYPPEAAGSLNPVFYDSMDPVFRPEDDILQDIPHYSLNLGPGQLLFVPAGSPHKVENIEASVAVSGNFVNNTNLNEAVQHFKINSLLDPRTQDLLQELLQLKIIE